MWDYMGINVGSYALVVVLSRSDDSFHLLVDSNLTNKFKIVSLTSYKLCKIRIDLNMLIFHALKSQGYIKIELIVTRHISPTM